MNGDLLDAWARWQIAADRAPSTIYLQRRYLERLAEAHDLDTVTSDEVAGWLAGHAWSRATKKSARSSLRSFFGWAQRHGHREDDPSALLGPVKQLPPCPRPTADTVFVRACQEATGEQLLMLLLAACCGLRRAEIAGLHTDMIAARKIRVTGKGGRTRMVPVANDDLAQLLEDVPEGWLFPGRFPDRPVTPDCPGHSSAGPASDGAAHGSSLSRGRHMRML